MEGRQTIIIKSQTVDGEEEELEEIEIDDGQFVTATTTSSSSSPSVEYQFNQNSSNDVNVNVVDFQALFGVHPPQIVTTTARTGNAMQGTFTIKTNPITGSLQLIPANNTTIAFGPQQLIVSPDHGNVEVVQLNTLTPTFPLSNNANAQQLINLNRMGQSQGGLIFTQTSGSSRYKAIQPRQQPTNTAITIAPQKSSAAASKTSWSPAQSVIRPLMKNAPALLRSSRRGVVAATVAGPSAASSSSRPAPDNSVLSPSLTNSGDKGPGKESSATTKSGHANQQKADKSRFKTQSISKKQSANAKTEDIGPQPPLTYIIYEDEYGEQIAPINDSSYSFLPSSEGGHPIIFQIEDSNSMFLTPTDSSDAAAFTRKKKTAAKCKQNSEGEPKRKYVKKTITSKIPPAKPDKPKKPVSELKCMEIGCQSVSHNVLELRRHLTNEHDMIFDFETADFPSDAAFREWRQQYERERMVSFIYRGGTKKISKDQAVTYMICHRSGHYKPTMEDASLRKRKMKPQGSCKIGGYCTAGIKLLKQVQTGEVRMEICHTHYGHPLDSGAIPHLRVNPLLKNIILKKFEEGMSFSDMLAYIHHNPDRLEGLRMVDRRAVRNIYDTWKQSADPSPKKKRKTGDKPYSDVVDESNGEFGGDSGNSEYFEADPNSNQVSEKSMSLDEVVHVKEPKNAAAENSLLVDHIGTENSVSESKYESASTNQREDEDDSNDQAPVLRSMAREPDTINLADCFANDSMPPTLTAFEPITKIESQESCKKSLELKRKSLLPAKNSEKSKSQVKPITESVSVIPSTARKTRRGKRSREKTVEISPDLDATIDRLHNHGESGPTILLYKTIGEINIKYGGFGRFFKEDDFCLIIQTPVQRQILQMFPKIINFEILDKVKPTNDDEQDDLKLAYISVLDDFREPIPVAWIVSDSFGSRMFHQLFRTLRYHCGQLPVEYLIAPRNVEIVRAWSIHFIHKPKLLQSQIYAKRELRSLLNRNIPNDRIRAKTWSILKDMIYQKSSDNLRFMKDVIYKFVEEYPDGPAFFKRFEKEWFTRIEEWSFAYRTDATINLLFIDESFLKLKKFVSFKTTKKLNETVDHILKIGYDKCFLRTKRMFKGDQKFCRVLEAVQAQHSLAKTELKEISVISHPDDEFKWSIELNDEKDNEKDKREVEINLLKSCCNCKIICKSCQICMHRYICSCNKFREDHVMCSHIHKVHAFLNPEPETGDEVNQLIEGNLASTSSSVTALPQINVVFEKPETVGYSDGTDGTHLLTDGFSLAEVFQNDSVTDDGMFSQQNDDGPPKVASSGNESRSFFENHEEEKGTSINFSINA